MFERVGVVVVDVFPLCKTKIVAPAVVSVFAQDRNVGGGVLLSKSFEKQIRQSAFAGARSSSNANYFYGSSQRYFSFASQGNSVVKSRWAIRFQANRSMGSSSKIPDIQSPKTRFTAAVGWLSKIVCNTAGQQ